jgi:hypothetical protein
LSIICRGRLYRAPPSAATLRRPSDPEGRSGRARDAIAPQNVALEELHLESWFPLDDGTAEVCARLARG